MVLRCWFMKIIKRLSLLSMYGIMSVLKMKNPANGICTFVRTPYVNGSENFNDDYFQALERVGATNLNGTTNNDRTNYFKMFRHLHWMLHCGWNPIGWTSSRCYWSEKTWRTAWSGSKWKAPRRKWTYAVADELIINLPGRQVIHTPVGYWIYGRPERGGFDDVQEWFKTYYGAANAVLVVAGDVTPDLALEKVKKYFGDIPSGPPVAHQSVWIANVLAYNGNK